MSGKVVVAWTMWFIEWLWLFVLVGSLATLPIVDWVVRHQDAKGRFDWAWLRRRLVGLGVPPVGWVAEGSLIPTLHGVAYRTFEMSATGFRVRTAWLGLHWVIGLAWWCWWEAKQLRFQHGLPIDRYFQRRGMSRVCPCCGLAGERVQSVQFYEDRRQT